MKGGINGVVGPELDEDECLCKYGLIDRKSEDCTICSP